MKNLQKQVQKLADHLSNSALKNPSVSSVTVGWHIEHSLLVIKQITATVAQSDPALFKPKFNFTRFFVLLFNYIPRGKAKAPKVVIPSSTIDANYLKESIEHTYQAIAYLNDCLTNQYFMHPVFGSLNKPQTIRFLTVHTNHHLKIIADIATLH